MPAHGGSSQVGIASAGPVRTAGVISSNQLVARDVSTIIVPIAALGAQGRACPGTQLPRFKLPQIRAAIFQEANPRGVTVGSTFNRCSYGKSKLTTGNSLVAEVVELPCQATTKGRSWTFSKCEFDDFDGYADAADAVLIRRGINLNKYRHRVYLLPPSACDFVGMGYVGCDANYECRSWIGPDHWNSPAAMAHEIGHNLFLGHAGATTGSGTFVEYADLSGTMGYCCSDRCPNTAHAWQLGWVSVRQFGGRELTPGATVTAVLASQSSSPNSGLRIVPSWAKGVEPLFVGYRTRMGGDATAGTDVATSDDMRAGRVHLYSANISGSFDARVTRWEASLGAAGEAWTHRAAGLVVRLKSTTRVAAVVTLCRKAGRETAASCRQGLDNDCNGLTGGRDPACIQLTRRAAARAAAQGKKL